MIRGHMAVLVALGGASLAAATSATGSPAHPYTMAPTKACLERLPGEVAGLPPAQPPVPPVLFVYSFPRDRLPQKAVGTLGAWYGPKREGAYHGVTLSFFKTAQDARASLKSEPWQYVGGGKLVRNVVASGGLVPGVIRCLRAESPAGTPPPRRPTPRASLATFAGPWGGHTRRLQITARGRGTEVADNGCCVRSYDMTFQILSVRGTLTRATATYRVTSFNPGDTPVPRPRVGQIRKLLLRNGIVTNALTRDYFCSDPAWDATGACGA